MKKKKSNLLELLTGKHAQYSTSKMSSDKDN